jgi:hypothetical protein
VKLPQAWAARAEGRAVLTSVQGFVPLPGMVGYGAFVWDLLPTYPPQNYGTWCPGGSDLLKYPPRITGHDAENQRNYSGNQVK